MLQPARLRVERPHVRREEGPQKRNAVRVISSDRTSDRICNARRQVGRACRTGQALLEAQETVREERTPNGLKPLRTVLLHGTTVPYCTHRVGSSICCTSTGTTTYRWGPLVNCCTSTRTVLYSTHPLRTSVYCTRTVPPGGGRLSNRPTVMYLP